MIAHSTLEFLQDLTVNNNREWFAQNKTRYEAAKANVEAFALQAIAGIREFDERIGSLEPKDCMFRIYRDARFSHDKSPYKTNFGLSIQPNGKKSLYSGYYFHIAPAEAFIAGGIYMPTPEQLKLIRELIDTNFEDFEALVEAPEFKKHFGSLKGDRLVNVPRGFSKETPAAGYVKMKQFFVDKAIQPETIARKTYLPEALEAFRALKPLNDFFNEAIEEL